MSLRDRAARRGFTILELCLSLVAVSLTAAIAIWLYFSRADVTLVNAANLLVDDLILAQSRAASLHTPIEVVFHPDGGGYYMSAVLGDALPTEASPRRYDADAIFEGVKIGQCQLGPDHRLLFDARGRPTANASITVVYRGESRTVLVRTNDAVAFLADEPRH
jgi:Tfp pilus assembly protein FimT